MNEIEDMIGATIVEITGAEKGSSLVHFKSKDGRGWEFYHDQDCCETVEVEDICGDISDLIGEPLVEAEVVTNSEDATGIEYPDSFTWTFYKFGTRKGHVTIRWLGESNGYYSEEVDVSKTWHGEGLPVGFSPYHYDKYKYGTEFLYENGTISTSEYLRAGKIVAVKIA